MPNPILGDFVGFEFSEEELKEIPNFTPLQLMWFQNEKAKAASEKIRLIYDPEKHAQFGIDHAYNHGKLDLLDIIITMGQSKEPPETESQPSADQSAK